MTSYPCPSFSKTQIQNDPLLLPFSNFSGVVWTEMTSDALSERKISPVYVVWEGLKQAANLIIIMYMVLHCAVLWRVSLDDESKYH